MSFGGSGVTFGSMKTRLLLFVAGSLVAFGAIMIWRQQLLVSSEYVPIPAHEIKKKSVPAPQRHTEELQKALTE
jgi:hypothetical protein